jgi:hypothetical protein
MAQGAAHRGDVRLDHLGRVVLVLTYGLIWPGSRTGLIVRNGQFPKQQFINESRELVAYLLRLFVRHRMTVPISLHDPLDGFHGVALGWSVADVAYRHITSASEQVCSVPLMVNVSNCGHRPMHVNNADIDR